MGLNRQLARLARVATPSTTTIITSVDHDLRKLGLNVAREPDHVAEMLKLCLQKICELQASLENEEDVHDPEAAGYFACAVETLRFSLSAHGLPPDHPMVKSITEKILRE
ncbi:hypothetical protein NQ317_012338 [Molorchus minor]|uniref:Uncharacterized protein n=1 Tax=Molorchus minor TaxID=1323400 RepID=A0ABQ9IR20_9CUCU|nr:hypothetical protein NQ317_012338 [Molorchus minor]